MMQTNHSNGVQPIQEGRWWDEAQFQDNLIGLLTRDTKSLQQVGRILQPADFKAQKGVAFGRSRWVVAERALQHYKVHHEAIGTLLVADVTDYAANSLSFGAGQMGDLRNYLGHLQKVKPKAPQAIIEKVIAFKSNQFKDLALDEMNALMAAGQLTDEKWHELSKQALRAAQGPAPTTKFLADAQARLDRRRQRTRSRIPFTFIDPLDALVATVGPGELGLVLAPYKRGKSMFLEWISIAFARQRLNTLHITLEDPLRTVEDRLDSIVTSLPMKQLADKPKTWSKRLERFRNMVRAEIEIYDGTKQEMTIPSIEAVVEDCRERGFIPQALVVDYDDKIMPERHQKDRRHEIDEVYRGFQSILSRYNLIGWLAAQTVRNTRERKILSGDTVAEDIGKMRKVTCGISMGKGEWTDHSIYLYIAAHKNDFMDKGCEIVPDLPRAMIYDEEATRRAARSNQDVDEEDD